MSCGAEQRAEGPKGYGIIKQHNEGRCFNKQTNKSPLNRGRSTKVENCLGGGDVRFLEQLARGLDANNFFPNL